MSDAVQSPGRVRAQAIVLLLLAFLAGTFAGGAIERVSHGRMRGDRPSHGFFGGMGRGFSGRGRFPGIYDSLNLSVEQRAKIDTIMTRQRPAADSLRNAMESNREAVRRQIEAVLTPSQKAKADTMRARLDSTLHARSGGMRPHSDSGRPRPF